MLPVTTPSVLCSSNILHETACILWFLVSDVSPLFALLSAVHLQPPLTSHRFSATRCTHFLLCSLMPTSTHVLSRILHLQHHIRPVLFLHSSLIYIPPPPPSSLLVLPLCFALSGSLSAPKKSFSRHRALWCCFSSPFSLRTSS